MRKPVSNRQYLDTEMVVITFDNSATPSVTRGQNQVTVARSNGSGTRDRITITFKKPIFSMTPTWIGQPSTLDAEFRDVAGTSTKSALVIDCRLSSNLATAVSDVAGTIVIIGATAGSKEGNY